LPSRPRLLDLGTWLTTLFVLALPQVIFDFRFLALLAVAGSMAGSLLCFLNVSVCPYLFLLNTKARGSDRLASALGILRDVSL
jgi:hypothetical protein